MNHLIGAGQAGAHQNMNIVETYGPFLPYLRRFSRALMGSQDEGDKYVRIALEALAAGEASIDAKLPPKIALYNMFLGIWNSTGAQLEDAPTDGSLDRLRKLAPHRGKPFYGKRLKLCQ